jgi:hypothetical protein
MPERTYPHPAPAEDPRFTLGLLSDVAAVLERHGYGRLSGAELARLQSMLFNLLYGL